MALTDLQTRIAFPDARRAMLARTTPLAPETVALLDAHGRIAAETARAKDDIVPFARSAMDGYALRASETAGASASAPRRLPVSDATYAGDVPPALLPGSAMAITTGGMLPDGADAVVPFEEIDRDGATIALRAALVPLDHVFEPGDDARRGDVLVRAGERITPGRAALLASAGFATIAVHRRPRVAIVSTGNELVAIEATPGRGQIRNSNATMLAACACGDGAELVFIEHARDAEAPLRETLERALACADLVVTTGGASTGERDLVKGTLRALGGEFAFDSIALRPAKPTGFAVVRGRLVAVLPGNPAAPSVMYTSTTHRVTYASAGDPVPYPRRVDATIGGRLHRKANRHFLMFARASLGTHGFTVEPLENQCSSLVRTSADANALIVAEPGTGYLEPGDRVPIELLDAREWL
ncbi:MAG: molybdopterin molybdotransferase MoeA [Vulcanimicrobiaceae bacterium]